MTSENIAKKQTVDHYILTSAQMPERMVHTGPLETATRSLCNKNFKVFSVNKRWMDNVKMTVIC